MTTIAALHQAFLAGQTTPSAVADRFLGASPTGAPWHAFRSVDADDVRAQAAASTDRYRAGTPIGPLDGVPVGIKDMFGVKGHSTYSGTRDLIHHGDTDAVVVTRLRVAGAIIAGKTHCTELGLAPTGLNTVWGTPVNPSAPDRIPGGSSSGTGVAVAAGLTPMSVGSDGGGSVRIPSACTGVFGIKPSFDLVPHTGGSPIGWWSLDHVGPLTTSADDLVTSLQVMADQQITPPDTPLTYAVDWAWWGQPDPALDGICRAIVAELRPTSVSIPHIHLAQVAGYVTAVSELTAGVWDAWQAKPTRFSPDVTTAIAAHEAVSGADYVRAQQARQALADALDQMFTTVDVLVSPATAVPAPERPSDRELAGGILDIDMIESMTRYAFPANLCGLPAAVVPVGTTPGGVPVGLQLIGRRGADATVLAAAIALERAGLAAAVRPAAQLDLRDDDPPVPATTHPRRR